MPLAPLLQGGVDKLCLVQVSHGQQKLVNGGLHVEECRGEIDGRVGDLAFRVEYVDHRFPARRVQLFAGFEDLRGDVGTRCQTKAGLI